MSQVMSSTSSIRDFYDGKVIFMTGVTGFVGKFLLEKLLRCCNPEKIYVLIRSKRGESSTERLEKFLKTPIFGFKLDPSRLTKVIAVNGNIADARVILDPIHLKVVLEEVTIVIHAAANIRFSDPFKVAFDSNVRGTNNVLNLTRHLKRVDVFVYISSVSCQAHRTKKVEEEVSPQIPNLDEMLKINGNKDIKWLEELAEDLAPEQVTTYTFSKNIAESLVAYVSNEVGFPAAIIRPPLINPPAKEPVTGFTDEAQQAFTGFGMLVVLGFLKVVMLDGNIRLRCSYADVVVNQIIGAAWDASISSHKNLGKSVSVYNSGMAGQTINEMIRHGITAAKATPSMFTARPLKHFQCVKKTRINIIRAFFVNTCFAYLVDIFIRFSGNRIRISRLMKKLKEVQKDLLQLEVRFSRADIICENLANISSNMSDEEKEIFYFEAESPDQEYYNQWGLQGRRHIMYEKDSTIPAAKRKLKIMSGIFTCINWFFIILLFALITCALLFIFFKFDLL